MGCLQAVHPAYVVLELCQARLRGLLLDPYSDPLHDLEPCPHKMAAAAEQQNKTLLEIVKSALSSRDHNIATAMLAVSGNKQQRVHAWSLQMCATCCQIAVQGHGCLLQTASCLRPGWTCRRPANGRLTANCWIGLRLYCNGFASAVVLLMHLLDSQATISHMLM